MSNSARPGPPRGKAGEGGAASGAPGSIAPSATGQTTCMLLIDDRVVLRASTPPEAEFAMFEIGDIELRSSEPGRVREHGYQTTAADARLRLSQVGATPHVARECAEAMQPVLAAAYARGPAVQHVAKLLGPTELLQADGYDGQAHVYRGVFLELPTLAKDLDLPGASAALQALYLAALLEGEPDETTVFLSTDSWTKIRKPGERTHRRPNLAALRALPAKLAELAARDPRPTITDHLARADVIAFVRTRADVAPDEEARALYATLERAITVRETPEKGPLADPTLWALEVKLDAGVLDGVLEGIDEAERTTGRTPGTTYLRSRASLALRLEPPKLIAERVSALALSMTSFQELSLLAAEAWLEAGDSRRAMPYARDLVDAPGIEEGLLLRAQRLLARAVGAAPDRHKTYMDSIPAAPMPPSSRHPVAMPVSPPEPHVPRSFAPEPSRIPTNRGSQAPAIPPEAPREPAPAYEVASAAPPPPPSPPPSRPPTPPPPSPQPPPQPIAVTPKSGSLPPLGPLPPASAPPKRRPTEAPAIPSAPPPLDLELTPQPRRPSSHVPATADASAPASFTLELPGPEIAARHSSQPPPRRSAPPPEIRETPRESPQAIAQGAYDSQRVASTAPAEPRAEERGGPVARPSRKLERQGGHVKLETRAPPAFDPRAEPESERDVASLRQDDVFEGTRRSRRPSAPPPKPARDSARPSRASKPPPSADAHASSRVPPSADAHASSRVPPSADAHARPTPLRPPAASEPPFRAPMQTPVLDAGDLPPTSTEEVARTIDREKGIQRGDVGSPLNLHGASLPPFRLENPPPLLPKAPLFPKMGSSDELVEHLTLPPGLSQDPRGIDVLPKSVLEARVAFTLLARELGLDYRLKRGLELRADVSGIEAMQAVLLETFPDHTIRSADDAHELRRHGALLSEILARHLDAEWIDISPNELGYWAMIVPPDTRVWPFGRVARLIEMGHKERDLVSYFLELSSRARGR
ncbi:MAG: hypothetical protein JST00_27355 [Deltaproteobacteria bacterium]|nr:hypothetical protein [Deltaproteobacteria bacterium]